MIGYFKRHHAVPFIVSLAVLGGFIRPTYGEQLPQKVVLTGFILDAITKRPLTEYHAVVTSDQTTESTPLPIAQDGSYYLEFDTDALPSYLLVEADALGHYPRKAQIILPADIEPGDRLFAAAIGLQPYFGITVIPNLDTTTYLEPRSINDRSEVTGYRMTLDSAPAPTPVFVWSEENGMAGVNGLRVKGIANSGELYGKHFSSLTPPNGGPARTLIRGQVRKLRWNSDVNRELTLDCLLSPLQNPTDCSVEPMAMNSDGIAVGFIPFDSLGESTPFAWILNADRTSVTKLPLEHRLPASMDPTGIQPPTGDLATAINHDGFVVGQQHYRYRYYIPVLEGNDAGKLIEKHDVIYTAFFWTLGNSFAKVRAHAGCLLGCPETLPTRPPGPGEATFTNVDPFDSTPIPAIEEVNSTAEDVNDNYEVVGTRYIDESKPEEWPIKAYRKTAYIHNAIENKTEILHVRNPLDGHGPGYPIPTGISNSGIITAMVVASDPVHWRPIDSSLDYGNRYGPAIPLDNSIPAGVGTVSHPWDINNRNQIVTTLRTSTSEKTPSGEPRNLPESFLQESLPYCYTDLLEQEINAFDQQYATLLTTAENAIWREEAVILEPNQQLPDQMITATKRAPECWTMPEAPTAPATPEPEPIPAPEGAKEPDEELAEEPSLMLYEEMEAPR